MEDNRLAIGARIRAERIKLGLSQEELAKKAYMSRRSISNYESGNVAIRAEDLITIAQALERDPGDFISNNRYSMWQYWQLNNMHQAAVREIIESLYYKERGLHM